MIVNAGEAAHAKDAKRVKVDESFKTRTAAEEHGLAVARKWIDSEEDEQVDLVAGLATLAAGPPAEPDA